MRDSDDLSLMNESAQDYITYSHMHTAETEPVHTFTDT